jgi:hypothetical protein
MLVLRAEKISLSFPTRSTSILGLARQLIGHKSSSDDEFGQCVRDLAVGFQIGLNVLLHSEGHVRVADALAERLPVNLRGPASASPCTSTAKS